MAATPAFNFIRVVVAPVVGYGHSWGMADNPSDMLEKHVCLNDLLKQGEKPDIASTFDVEKDGITVKPNKENDLFTEQYILNKLLPLGNGVVLFKCGTIVLVPSDYPYMLFDMCRYRLPPHRYTEETALVKAMCQNYSWWEQYQREERPANVRAVNVALHYLRSAEYPRPGTRDADSNTLEVFKTNHYSDVHHGLCALRCGLLTIRQIVHAKPGPTGKWTESKEYEMATLAKENYRLDYMEPRVVKVYLPPNSNNETQHVTKETVDTARKQNK